MNITTGAVLLALLVTNYAPTSSSSPEEARSFLGTTVSGDPSQNVGRCARLLQPISAKDIMDTIFSGKWILQEAYSSDPIDQNALTHSNSSWAEFTKGPNGTINLHMAHMLTTNGKPWCVYHHFSNIKLRKNVLYLDLPQYNALAKMKFLKACDECLVLIAEAIVPGYEPLNYLLAYGLHPELNEYFLRPTREQASCNGLKPPPPFHYKGAELCPDGGVRFQVKK